MAWTAVGGLVAWTAVGGLVARARGWWSGGMDCSWLSDGTSYRLVVWWHGLGEVV